MQLHASRYQLWKTLQLHASRYQLWTSISSLVKASVESFRPVHRSRRLPDVPRVVSTAPALVSNATITVCSDSSIDSDVVLLSSCSRCMARGALVHLLGGVLVNDVLCFASTGERVR